MRQVLFEIPGLGWPIYGYGFMLLVAFLVCTNLAARTVERYGGTRDMVYDLSLWLFLPGLIGGRIFYMIEYHSHFQKPLLEFFFLWQGGLVIYGAAIGALVGLLIFCRRYTIRPLWLLDLIAPSVALGYALGRVGCLLNGCCFGDYCDQAWAITFPPNSPAYYQMVQRGHQTRLGFALSLEDDSDRRVLLVEPGTAAARAGLRPGDVISAVDGQAVADAVALQQRLAEVGRPEPAGLGRPAHARLAFTVTVPNEQGPRTLALTLPASLPVHPTQLYATINGVLLWGLLTVLLPFPRREGDLIGIFAMEYALTRFLIEYLRYDEAPLWDGLTISQNISFLMFAAGVLLLVAPRLKQLLSSPAKGRAS